VTTPQPAELQKVQRRMMTGAMLVMGACLFGGLTAVLLMALGQRTAAAIVAVIAGLIVVAGVVVQVAAVRRMKQQQASPK
jgi:VIT1/CCC1 family predicted Fe2+/Mn2+ transporter